MKSLLDELEEVQDLQGYLPLKLGDFTLGELLHIAEKLPSPIEFVTGMAFEFLPQKERERRMENIRKAHPAVPDKPRSNPPIKAVPALGSNPELLH